MKLVMVILEASADIERTDAYQRRASQVSQPTDDIQLVTKVLDSPTHPQRERLTTVGDKRFSFVFYILCPD